MINFFRKIRKQLASENKFQKYSRYAIGEILLIVIGIFFALQLQNWNENRKQDMQFKIVLEQLYNSIKMDTDVFNNNLNVFQNEMDLIDTLLIYPNIPPERLRLLPVSLYFMDAIDNDKYISESNHFYSFLKFNPDNKKQNEIALQISNYINNTNNGLTNNPTTFHSFLMKHNIALGGFDMIDVYEGDSLFYSDYELDKMKDLLQSEELKALLKTTKVYKGFMFINSRNYMGDGLSIMKLIKKYNPEVKLLFQDIGIIGVAINGYDVPSIPMKLINEQYSIWELDITLKNGTVKFRSRDSWNKNWGGNTFPNGNTAFRGFDIPVKAGNYHVILNLFENTYQFIKKEDQ